MNVAIKRNGALLPVAMYDKPWMGVASAKGRKIAKRDFKHFHSVTVTLEMQETNLVRRALEFISAVVKYRICVIVYLLFHEDLALNRCHGVQRLCNS